jgi:hypothetical protein
VPRSTPLKIFFRELKSIGVNAVLTQSRQRLTIIAIPADKQNLTDALDWIRNNAVDWGAYTITVKANETNFSEQSLSYNGKRVNITLKGNAAGKKVTLKDDRNEDRDQVSLFIVRRGVTLTVENLTLSGWGIDGEEEDANKSALVQVNAGGVLNLKTGAVITGNYNRESGGAVIVNQNAAFIMEGGEIKGSKAREGGGVDVRGTFTMTGGEISGNEAERGGGVRVGDNAIFTLKGGVIKTNTAPDDAGGGVEVRGTFTMTGGEISGNEAERGGGVRVGDNAIFTLENGTIKDNTAREGGGVKIDRDAEFTMKGGEISGNTATEDQGGGVRVGDNAIFTLENGTIKDNTAREGGGVNVDRDAAFTMKGGTISGNEATENPGGGVKVNENAIFIMEDGVISGNKASKDSGGGVDVYKAEFTMKGGTISGNTAKGGGGVRADTDAVFTLENGTISGNTAGEWGGGGVKVGENGTFTKKGGIIYGDTDATHTADRTENTATADNGHAVQLDGEGAKKRDTDAGAGVKLYARYVDDRWTYNDSSTGGVGDTAANWEDWD